MRAVGHTFKHAIKLKKIKVMKLQTIILAVSFLLVGATSFAGNGESVFRKKVNSKIKYPENVSQKVDVEVYVQFTVLESGEIQIDSISSESEEINKSIADQIKALKVSASNTDVIGKTFRYKFLMKVQ
ncbi:MAG: hypothetical protein A3D31_10820 [Candidatus Fluviicola riflensis]|nr:MAG: hypothetical protein CHH17_15240 [Candidatus Fluviicola riflensis]OGS77488.1 MAG: hypothetical protein A3D31_10820 [Candidatus Fluviicola riflensis]OGS84068.1 MAG: hypothetical protein A3E30_12220 [Fluviicola sp. RIFCSPHIGHO2_12_FULL_43_24]OGS84555.1 MAG: hypothetical protein A2724_07760 [Fluviicola sp. RIFCSPHIGHO2_01_FULL_43_53]